MASAAGLAPAKKQGPGKKREAATTNTTPHSATSAATASGAAEKKPRKRGRPRKDRSATRQPGARTGRQARRPTARAVDANIGAMAVVAAASAAADVIRRGLHSRSGRLSPTTSLPTEAAATTADPPNVAVVAESSTMATTTTKQAAINNNNNKKSVIRPGFRFGGSSGGGSVRQRRRRHKASSYASLSSTDSDGVLREGDDGIRPSLLCSYRAPNTADASDLPPVHGTSQTETEARLSRSPRRLPPVIWPARVEAMIASGVYSTDPAQIPAASAPPVSLRMVPLSPGGRGHRGRVGSGRDESNHHLGGSRDQAGVPGLLPEIPSLLSADGRRLSLDFGRRDSMSDGDGFAVENGTRRHSFDFGRPSADANGAPGFKAKFGRLHAREEPLSIDPCSDETTRTSASPPPRKVRRLTIYGDEEINSLLVEATSVSVMDHPLII